MSSYPYQNLGYSATPPGNLPVSNISSGYPPSGNYPPNNPSFPPSQYPQPNMNQGGYPNPTQGGYPNPTQGGYPNPTQGGYPNPNVPAYPSQPGGDPNAGYNPGMGVSQPGFQPAVCPSAPDLGQMEKIPGYEGLTFEDAILVPPSYPVWQPDNQDRQPLPNLPVLSEEDVHDAVTQYSSEHCCYGSKAAREMDLREINMMSAFHYKLDTFTEKRESAWRFEPYKGQAIDGPSNGPAPSPWDVPATASSQFVHSKVKMEVPHTAFVKPCHMCVGNSRVRCDLCAGNGRKQCTWCDGRGRKTTFDRNEICSSCNGTGFDRCIRCSGTGQVKCKTCDGRGNLKGFVELTVTWSNHTEDYISETSSMPRELVRSVTGQVAYEEENPRVFPITQATDQAVCNASNDLVTKHSTAFVNERILKQRQCLRIIPIGHVRYEWKNKMDEFFVYGFEHKVHFKKYPQKCCCTIL